LVARVEQDLGVAKITITQEYKAYCNLKVEELNANIEADMASMKKEVDTSILDTRKHAEAHAAAARDEAIDELRRAQAEQATSDKKRDDYNNTMINEHTRRLDQNEEQDALNLQKLNRDISEEARLREQGDRQLRMEMENLSGLHGNADLQYKRWEERMARLEDLERKATAERAEFHNILLREQGLRKELEAQLEMKIEREAKLREQGDQQLGKKSQEALDGISQEARLREQGDQQLGKKAQQAFDGISQEARLREQGDQELGRKAQEGISHEARLREQGDQQLSAALDGLTRSLGDRLAEEAKVREQEDRNLWMQLPRRLMCESRRIRTICRSVSSWISTWMRRLRRSGFNLQNRKRFLSRRPTCAGGCE